VLICDGAYLQSAIANKHIMEINATFPSRGWPAGCQELAPGDIFDNPFYVLCWEGGGGRKNTTVERTDRSRII
jgi:hypothetical protein